MYLLVNGQPIAAMPAPEGFKVWLRDLDDASATERTADGKLKRSRITTKRQIDLRYNALEWSVVSALFMQLDDEFAEVTYPDPRGGQYETRTFYTGDRPATVPFERDGKLWWNGVEYTLTEQ